MFRSKYTYIISKVRVANQVRRRVKNARAARSIILYTKWDKWFRWYWFCRHCYTPTYNQVKLWNYRKPLYLQITNNRRSCFASLWVHSGYPLWTTNKRKLIMHTYPQRTIVKEIKEVLLPIVPKQITTYLYVYVIQRGGASLHLLNQLLRALQTVRPRLHCRNLIVYHPIAFGTRTYKRWARRKKRLQRRRATVYKIRAS